MISAAGIDLIKKHEQCRLTVYKDPAGVLTCGWGATGPDIAEGTTWTQEQADARLEADLHRFDQCVTMDCATATQGQHDAMCSLSYNIGCGAFTKSSVARLHNAGQFPQAAAAFGLWNKAGGKVLVELVHRRAEEAAMYAAASPIDEATRVDVPSDAEGPPKVSKTAIANVTTLVSGGTAAVAAVHDQAQQLDGTLNAATESVSMAMRWGMLAHHLASWPVLAAVCVICGAALGLYAWWKEKQEGRR